MAERPDRWPSFGHSLLTSLLYYVVVLALLFPLPQQIHAQYTQELEEDVQLGTKWFYWRPTPTGNRYPIVLSKRTVVLEYNCYYMTAICLNAKKYFERRGLELTLFNYDFDSARTRRRRRRVCPTGRNGWKKDHKCPETDFPQPPVWRSDGVWPTTRLEETNPLDSRFREIAMIKIGDVEQRSGLQYSCDEFPPASWIEGGDGFQGSGTWRANTICAAIRICKKGQSVNGEQNWQGALHGILRKKLLDAIREANGGVAPDKNSPATFVFNMVNEPRNNIAGRVGLIPQNSPDDVTDKILNRRRYLNHTIDDVEWLGSSRPKELSLAQDFVVFANETDLSHHFGYDDELDNYTYGNLDDDTEMDHHEASKFTSSHSSPIRTTNGGFGGQNWNQHGITVGVSRRGVNDTLDGDASTPLLQNATQADIDRARKIVADAQVQMGEHNRARIENMARRRYRLAPGTIVGDRKVDDGMTALNDDGEQPVPPLFQVTEEIARAAALVAEADAPPPSPGSQNFTRRAAGDPFWMERITRRGTVPWGDDPNYKVFRNVRDYGAKGDGAADDTAAIMLAMRDGNRCAENCNGATTKNAVVYFPKGTYAVTGTIQVLFGTQMIGDANSWPTILAKDSFVGLGVLSTDEYVVDGGNGTDGKPMEWYINTASFYRQIRNFRIDITQTPADKQVCGIHYQIAQATSLQFVEIIAKTGTTQQGICKLPSLQGQTWHVAWLCWSLANLIKATNEI